MRSQISLKTEGLFKSTFSFKPTRYSQNRSLKIMNLPWHFPVYQRAISTSSAKKPAITTRFFDVFEEYKKTTGISPICDILRSETALKKLLKDINSYTEGNYLQDHFIYWLSAYAAKSRDFLQEYLSGQFGLTDICKDFIHFCFRNGISLDDHKTLESFSYHNQLLDTSLKQELIKLTPKENINILGFGLDEGYYEKSVGRFLIDRGITKTVNIYGFDPYALKTPDIEYLEAEQLRSSKTLFDIVIARWVLHHVALQHRWTDFINCINHCKPGAMVLIVEHGFLKENRSDLDKRLYYLFNAIFDIVANIGLRPRYFTDTDPNLGANFFLHYLEPEDFNAIGNNIVFKFTQNIFDIGPGFPNQTICCMSLSS